MLQVATITVCAQPVRVKASVDKNKILLGEPFILTLEIWQPAGIKAAAFTIDSIAHFEILKDDSIKHVTENGTAITRQYYTITSFDSGRWVIPPQVLKPNVHTESILIDVVFSEPFDPAQPYHDIQDIRKAPINPAFELWWYLAALLLILLVMILYFITAPKRPKAQKPLPLQDPYKYVMSQLQKLQKENPEGMRYYMQLVDLFRDYVAGRTGIESLQQTSNDLAGKLKPLFKDPQRYHSLAQVLSLCDFVKFAKYHPETTEAGSAYEVITQSIEHIEQGHKQQKTITAPIIPAAGKKEGAA